MPKLKTAKQLERYFKGLANHRRLEILFLTNDMAGVSVEEIAKKLDCNFKTISEHTQRLVWAGLLQKRYHGRSVEHYLSPYGRVMIKFIQTFRHSQECRNVCIREMGI